MAGNTDADMALLDEPVTYHDLRAWIEEQERNPMPLSPLQKRAISDLRRSIEPEEPPVGDRDWVSLLNLFRQAHGATVDFDETSTEPGRYSYVCHLQLITDADPLIFPTPEAGFVPNGTGTPMAPRFHLKKAAKQYAAKCCIEWLMKGGYIPTDGKSVEFPKPKQNPAPAAKKSPKPAANNPTPPTGNNNNPNADDLPTPKRIESLCRLMGLAVPQYRITPSTTSSSGTGNPQQHFFDGHADFGADAIKVPDNLGKVVNVYGKKNARERIAEEVLAWLVAEEGRRVAEVEEMMAQIS